MKRLFLNSLLLCLLTTCRENNAADKHMYGAPEAKVTSEPNSDKTSRGPLAFAPKVPAIQDRDTVDVKFDVTHQLVAVSKNC